MGLAHLSVESGNQGGISQKKILKIEYVRGTCLVIILAVAKHAVQCSNYLCLKPSLY